MIQTENHLKLFLEIFFGHKKMILSSVIIFTLLSGLIAFFYPPVYRLSGELIVKSKKMIAPPESAEQSNSFRNTIPPTKEDTFLESKIITNPELIHESIEQLAKQGYPIQPQQGKVKIFFKKNIVQPVKSLLENWGILELHDPTSEIDVTATDISDNISSTILPGSNIIEVELFHSDPKIGSQILNSIFNNYLQYRHSVFSDPGTSDLFSTQVKRYKNALETLKTKRIQLLESYNLPDFEKQIAIEMELISSTRKTLFNLEDEFFDKNNEFIQLNTLFQKYSRLPIMATTPFPYDFKDKSLTDYQERLVTRIFEYLDASRIYRKNMEKVTLMEKEIGNLRTQFLTMIKQQITNRKNELKALHLKILDQQKRMDTLGLRAKKITEGGNELSFIDTDIRLTQENYEGFLKKFEEAKIEETSEVTQKSNVQVLNRSVQPQDPYFPQKKVVIPLGVLVGLLLGFSLACVADFFDHTFKRPSHVKDYLNIPVIGSIPYASTPSTVRI